MNARIWLAVPALALAVGVAQHRAPPTLAAAPAAAGGQDTSTLDDQSELALTVYNSDLALVRDVRTLQLPRGTFDLKFMDIAATVNPATVHFRSLTEPSRVSVLEQNYEYDLLEPDKLLRKYVGRDVTLVRTAATAARRARRRSRRGSSATTPRRCGRSTARSSPACTPITSAFRSCRATCSRARR